MIWFRWSCFALALIAIILAAYMFRYEPIAQSGDMDSLWRAKLWDRWSYRVCISSPSSTSDNKITCIVDLQKSK